ncbi:uncharacterized protein K02A2.6-like [Tachysurus ichikawai]
MQLMTALTLETAVQMTRQAEGKSNEPTSSGQEVTSKQAENRPWTREKYKRGSENRKEGTECGRCGKTGHKDIRKCPATSSECRKCKRKGHWARMCKSKTVRQVTAKDESDERAQ